MPLAMSLILGAALAQDAPHVEPDIEHPVQIVERQVVAEPVVAAPADDMATRVARLQAYKSQRLRVVTETELRGGVAAVAIGSPQPAGSLSPSVVMVDPVLTYQTWGIYQGNKRLSPATFLRQTGETFRADDLDRRTERDRRKARRWMLLAGAGATSLAMGMVGAAQAEDLPQQMLAQQLTLGGIGVGMTGIVGASFPASRATRMEHYPSSVLDRSDAEAMAERHNKALQQKLGLTAEDLLLLELADSL